MNVTVKIKECEDVEKHKLPQNTIVVLFSAGSKIEALRQNVREWLRNKITSPAFNYEKPKTSEEPIKFVTNSVENEMRPLLMLESDR